MGAITTMIRKDKMRKDKNKKPGKEKDGICPVIFYWNQQKIATGESCRSNVWDAKGQKANPQHSGSDLINRRLGKKKVALQSIIDSNPDADVKDIRAKFAAYLKNPDSLDRIISAPNYTHQAIDFYMLVQNILDEYENIWSDKYQLKFKTIRRKILEYDSTFDITQITVTWWNKFNQYCARDVEEGGLGNSDNTISTDAKVLSRLIDILRDRGFKFNPGLDQIGLSYTEPETRYLSWEKVAAIAEVDLSDPIRATMPSSRILWLIGAYTGRRWGEIARMTPENFYQDQEKRWRYKGSGKGKKLVDIPLLPEAEKLLKRIDFTPPVLAPQTVNKDIKDIARIADIKDQVIVRSSLKGKMVEEKVKEHETIHIHTGRHSYAMRISALSVGEANADKFISDMLGHATYSTSWKYLNLTKDNLNKMYDKVVREPEKRTNKKRR